MEEGNPDREHKFISFILIFYLLKKAQGFACSGNPQKLAIEFI
jgi:hypothetical protein